MYCTRRWSFLAGESCSLVAGHIGSCPTCSMLRQPKEEDARGRNFRQSPNFRSKRRCHASIAVNTSLHGHKVHNSLGLITPDQRLESSNTSDLSVPSHSDRPSQALDDCIMTKIFSNSCYTWNSGSRLLFVWPTGAYFETTSRPPSEQPVSSTDASRCLIKANLEVPAQVK
jgi:hypothetical protein